MTRDNVTVTKAMDRNTLASVWPPTGAVACQAGHRPMSPMQAIRRKCLDCSGQQPAEVRLCEATSCALWPFRAGRHPYTGKGLQEADLARNPAVRAAVMLL